MTIDHSGDFDARRIGWWQRRSTVRQLRKAVGLTAADRELRVQQARAAQTRGELNALTRGLGARAVSGPPPPTPAPPVQPPPVPPQNGSPPPPPARSYGQPQAWTPAVPRTSSQAARQSAGVRILIGLVVAFVVLSTTVVGCVSALVRSADFSFDTGASRPDLETARGWSEMVEAFGTDADLARTVEIVVTTSATLAVADPDDATQVERYYFDGDVTTTTGLSRSPSLDEFDLTQIDGDVVAEAIARARRESGADQSNRTLVRVTDRGAGPEIAIGFRDATAEPYRLVVDRTGEILSEYP